MILNVFIRMVRSSSSLRTATAVWITLAALCCLLSTGWAEVVDRIAAVVNNNAITLGDLNTQMQPYLEKIKSTGYPPDKEAQMISKVRKEDLSQLIDQKLTDQEIERNKITVADKDVDSAVERVKEGSSLTDDNFLKALEREGLTLETYRKNIREQLLRVALVNREIKSKVVVTKEEIKAYYDAHPELHTLEDKYHLQNVVMRYPEKMDNVSHELMMKKMNNIHKELMAGKSIDEIVRTFSGRDSAVYGGDLGSFTFVSLDPKIQDALKGMKPGEYSNVIETDQGCQIVFFQELVKTSSGKALDDIYADIENKLYKEQLDEKFSKWLEDLRSRSTIEVIQ